MKIEWGGEATRSLEPTETLRGASRLAFFILLVALAWAWVSRDCRREDDDHGVAMMVGGGLQLWHVAFLSLAATKALGSYRLAPKEERRRVLLWIFAAAAATPSYVVGLN